MWRVEPPQVTVVDAARTCAKGLRDRELAARLDSNHPALEANSREFRGAIATNSLHLVTAEGTRVPGISDAEFRSLYTNQVAKAGRPARQVYNAIMAGSLHGLCSYCQYGVAGNLDHFVPKSLVGALSIDPWNLVPSCRDCNYTLADEYSHTMETQQRFHPYSAPDVGRWLHARIIPSVPPVVEFYAEPDRSLDPETRDRIMNQFSALRLARTYALAAAPEVAEISRTISLHFMEPKPAEIRRYLEELAGGSFERDTNSRRGVVFEALSLDSWFCNGGFAG